MIDIVGVGHPGMAHMNDVFQDTNYFISYMNVTRIALVQCTVNYIMYSLINK